MMNKNTLLAVFLLFFAAMGQAQSAKEIIAKSDEAMRGNSSETNITMKIIRPEWSREMSMKSWSKGDDYFMVLVTAPAKDRGTVSLKRGKELWNWMPSIERTIKVSPSMMSQSWMGSDFSNDDLLEATSIVNDYTHKIVGEEKIDGHTCWKIEMIPNEDAAIVWGKVNVWISKEHYLQMKAENFDEDMYLVSTMVASKVKQMGGKLLPTVMEMTPADEPGNKTIMIYNTAKFDHKIPDSFFSMQNMRRVR
ncbi:outer membrane lipoprotein-sorting protein [Algivirga pacifica]|uniref:Outer membrane lipoprotein-sorting protein n=1 Tax=Algivirga pacifica TaxID=1162670 RepID=A0ABP9D5R9_9BACT